jgi:cobalt/nickel transport system permease protein
MFDPARFSLGGSSLLDRLDPRGRVLAAVAFAIIVAMSHRLSTLALALGVALAASFVSGLSPGTLLRRLAPLNLLLLLIVAILPLSTRGTPLTTVGPLVVSEEGLRLAAAIALKANAIVLALSALVATLDVNCLGHVLHHLYVPEKLVHLLLLTVRYLGVMHREHQRLSASMKIRGFRPGMNRHTYRSYGYLVGMLLVRSLDRSERIVAAMKCRGFRGHFYLLDHFAFSRRDVPFAAAVVAVLAILGLAEWR